MIRATITTRSGAVHTEHHATAREAWEWVHTWVVDTGACANSWCNPLLRKIEEMRDNETFGGFNGLELTDHQHPEVVGVVDVKRMGEIRMRPMPISSREARDLARQFRHTDGMAAAIAAMYQSPTGPGKYFAALASGAPVDYADLIHAIAEHRDPEDEETETDMGALLDWVNDRTALGEVSYTDQVVW